MFSNSKLTEAFEGMASRGLIAEQDFSCCSSCGGYEMAERATELVDEGLKPVGCVFYHNQDAEDLNAGKDFYLTYGGLDTSKHGIVGLPSQMVGQIVVEELTKAGIQTEWNGDPHIRILVVVRERSIN